MQNLSQYSKTYKHNKSFLYRFIWYVINIIVFKSYMFPFSNIKIILLKLFGAKVGKGIIIKPCVNIKYPWMLVIGDNVWIGEDVWFDNLGLITIGSNVCISQGAYLLTGNHNYKEEKFDLIVKNIVLDDGVWICAKAIVCPGITMNKNSILTAGSVLSLNTEEGFIYKGNPAQCYKKRY